MSHLLYVQASGRKHGSISRELGDSLIDRLKSACPGTPVKIRDVSTGLPYVSEDLIAAYFTAPEARTPAQIDLLHLSDSLVDELLAAKILVIATPMYNFGIPAALKAWIDLIVRVGRTFKYRPEGGVEALAGNCPTYIVVATGGVEQGTPADFVTPYLKTILGFVGITAPQIIYAGGTNTAKAESIIEKARKEIETLLLPEAV